jgi:hypothetical protein
MASILAAVEPLGLIVLAGPAGLHSGWPAPFQVFSTPYRSIQLP